MYYKIKTYALLALAWLIVCISQAQTVPLAGYWKMNEGTGSILFDNSGNANNAVFQNPKDIIWIAGIEGQAINLPGTLKRFAMAPNHASLNITNAITLAAWIKPVDLSSRSILSKTSPDGYELAVHKSGKVEFKFNTTTNGATYRILSNANYPTGGNTWMHVAATFDGTTSKIYINGVLDNSVTYNPVTIISNSSPLYIGAVLAANRWKGGLDEVRLYNGALTATEINDVKNIVPVPDAPLLSAPLNASVNVPVNITLSWNAVAGASGYRLEVSNNSTFSSIFFTQDNVATTSLVINNLLLNTTYYWRVRARNVVGEGDWSSTWSFTTIPLPPAAPQLVSPVNTATDVPYTTTLSWNSIAEALSYRIEISESPVFSTFFLAQENIVTNSIEVMNLLPNMVYYWRARATNSGGNSNWSETWSFTTAIPVPSLTLFHYWNFNDATNTTTLTTPTVTLNGGSLSADLAALSLIEAGTLNEFIAANARNGDPAGSHLRLNNPIGSTLTFHVSTTGFKDIRFMYETRRSTQGAERQIISYTLDGTSYQFLQVVNPFNGLPTLVTLDFSSIAAVNDNPNFKIQIQFEQGLGGTTGNNRFDNITTEGTPLNIILPPEQVITLLPQDGAQDVGVRPDLTWQVTAGAITYDIQVAKDDQFTIMVATETVTGQPECKLETSLDVATLFYWRVRAVNTAGAGSWSEVKSFHTILENTVFELAVNEVMSSNTSFIVDNDGTYQDWIEIVNYGNTSVNLQGIGLSDAAATPFKWVFPAKVLAPGEFLLIWASNKNRTDPAQPLHTNFAVSASGEEVLLTAPNGELINSMPPIAIQSNISRGRQPDGIGELLFFPTPTPGSSNTGGVASFLSKPTFSLPAGVYTTDVTLSITHTDPTVVIRYTLDGSDPTVNSTQYTQPILITDRSDQPNAHSMIPTNFIVGTSRAWEEPTGLVRKGTIIKAKAFKGSSETSVNSTGTYLILPGRQYTLPILSVILPFDSLFGYQRGIYVPGVSYIPGNDGTGNYYAEGDSSERPGSFEFFGPSFSFQQDVGYRINGDYTRRFPQKSLRVLARGEYGKGSIDYPLFANYSITSFRRLVLRNSGNDWGHTLFKDAMSQMLVSHIMPVQHYTPTVLYLNGEYWGIHNIRERVDKYFIGSLYGINPDNVDHLELENIVNDGDATHYNEMITYVKTNDLAVEANYDGLKTRMDVENFTDYYSAEIYYANHDWPQNNIEYWRERVPYNPAAPYGRDGRWRWLVKDIDLGFGDPTVNSVSRLLTQFNAEKNVEWPNLLLRNLLKNSEFKINFINRIADQLNTAFVPARINIIVDSLQALIEPEIPEHILRWPRPTSVANWKEDVADLKNFAAARPAYVREHVRAAFSLGNAINITLNVSDKTHGSINLNSLVINETTVGLSNKEQPFPWQGVYFANVPVKLKALANTGYVFDHWMINGQANTDLQITITPSANIAVTAYFVPNSGITPVLLTPANSSFDVAVSPADFIWNVIPQTTSYTLEVSRNPDFVTPEYRQTGITNSNVSVTGLLNGALYYWRVMAVGSYGSTNWSDTWSFTALPLPLPEVASLFAPADAATDVPVNATLQWNVAANATSYTVQVSSTADFSSYILNQTNVLTTSQSLIGLMNNGTYYWRVQSNNAVGSAAWSATRSFTVVPLVGKLLVGHWRMNEGGGSTLIDESGFFNNATLQNPKDITWITGMEGRALNMPGTLSRFGIAPHSSSLDITESISIAAWIRPIELSARTMISKTTPDGYEFRINSSNKVEFRFNTTTNGSTYTVSSATNYPYNGSTWMHVAATFDGQMAKVYINGVLDKSITFSGPVTIKSNTSGLYIGAVADAGRWKGGLDDLRLYKGALTASEVADIVSLTSAGRIASATVGMPETETLVTAYPNPVTERIKIDFKAGLEGDVSVSIVDRVGKTYYQATERLEMRKLEIDLGSELKPGMYFLFVKTDSFSKVIKLIKE